MFCDIHKSTLSVKRSFIIFQLCNVLLVHGQWFNQEPLSDWNSQSPADLLLGLLPDAFNKAQDIINSRQQCDAYQERYMDPRYNIPSARHQHFQSFESWAGTQEGIQDHFEETTKILLNKFNLTMGQILSGLSGIDHKPMLQKDIVENCDAQIISSCNEDCPYRTFDGSCNNFKSPSWGRAGACFQRLLYPDYADGISEKRVAISGNPLPPPRKISLEIHKHLNLPSDIITHFLMVLGQFIAHDISLTPQSENPNGQAIECCPKGDNDPPQCDPILLGENDPFYKAFGINCLNNQRSAKCPTCSLGPRQQIHQVTSYIDASHVYGLNQDASAALRKNDGSGTLLTNDETEGGELPPPSANPDKDFCSSQSKKFDCFQTGDQRANQHPALTSLHIIFLREHNRIARKLREFNSDWGEEQLFQEARRIVGAALQMIVYNEFLPLVIGDDKMNQFKLNVSPDGFSQYDNTVQADLFNEFSTAAYRFGHSLINSLFPRFVNGIEIKEELKDMYLFPFGLYFGQLEGRIEGLAKCPAQKFDRHMVEDVTNHLYQSHNSQMGLDLASINVNRGRDHGIPSYTKLVEYCYGFRITEWEQLDSIFKKGLRPLYQSLYENVQDIDLFSGGLAEKPIEGAIIGPTFACIIGKQFHHLKYGDRFYFEHKDQTGSFTRDQLQEIRKVTLARIICDNTKITTIQEKVMLFKSNRNPEMNCEALPEMNLEAWREESSRKWSEEESRRAEPKEESLWEEPDEESRREEPKEESSWEEQRDEPKEEWNWFQWGK